jgi:2-succinyl-6-hydroxy-2,4-cyclohexadiene-1-carboxylate synthase
VRSVIRRNKTQNMNTRTSINWNDYYTSITLNAVQMGVIELNKPLSPTTDHVTLVLLHGFTGNTLTWQSSLGEFALSSSEESSIHPLHIIALDMLGHGRSEAPFDPSRYSIENCQQDILAALQQLGVPAHKAILLGYSMGGRIALYTALSGYFRALILESASPGIADPAERAQRRQSDNELANRIEQDGIASFVDYWENIPLFASQQNLPAEVLAAQRAQRLANNTRGLANSLRGIGTSVQPPLYADLPSLTIPTLLITGDLDDKYTTIAQQMAHTLPNAHLSIVPNAGHTVHLEQPAHFRKLVYDFCTQLL